MSRLPVALALVVALVAGASARADNLWLERKGPPRVAMPSLAPLVQDTEPAVLSIFVESVASSSMESSSRSTTP